MELQKNRKWLELLNKKTCDNLELGLRFLEENYWNL